jgi:hypothetical protein
MKRSLGFFFALALASQAVQGQQSAQVLAGILEDKGILTSADRAKIMAAAPDDAVRMIADILKDKGLLSGAEVARVGGEHTTTMAAAPAPAPAPRGPILTAPPAVTRSKVPLTFYGTLLFNAFSNDSLNNNEDVPLFAGKQGTDATGGDKNFGMTARQTRMGMSYENTVGDAKVSGVFEFDLFGGSSTLPNGIGFDLFRARLAYGRIDWTNFSLEAGQDWSVFAPLNPTTYAGYATPDMASSGNLFARIPQIRAQFRHQLSDSSRLSLDLAATDPNIGDNPSTVSEARTAGIGERGRLPGAESRLAWSKDGGPAFGLSAHYSRGKNAGAIGATNVQRGVDSWGVAGDYTIPVTSFFNLTGEAYEGRALGIYGSALGESVGAVGTAGEHGVESRGGYIQAQTNFTKKWQNNISYGIDAMNAHQLPAGNRDKTQTYMTNLIYKWTPNVIFALEYRRFLTHFRNQLLYDELGDHVNLSVAFLF